MERAGVGGRCGRRARGIALRMHRQASSPRARPWPGAGATALTPLVHAHRQVVPEEAVVE